MLGPGKIFVNFRYGSLVSIRDLLICALDYGAKSSAALEFCVGCYFSLPEMSSDHSATLSRIKAPSGRATSATFMSSSASFALSG